MEENKPYTNDDIELIEDEEILEEEKVENEHRTRAERRHADWKKAIRKYKITKRWCSGAFGDYYKHLHQYSKNKIHCSCPMCRNKTNNKKGLYNPVYNPPVRDRKQIERGNQELREIEEGNKE